MSYMGEYRGRKKALPTIRLLPDGSGSAALYKDGVFINNVSYTTTGWTQLFSSTQNVMTVNMIEIFDSTGNSGQIGLGESGSEEPLLNIVPGGNGPITVRIDSGIRIAIKPSDTPSANTEILINFYD